MDAPLLRCCLALLLSVAAFFYAIFSLVTLSKFYLWVQELQIAAFGVPFTILTVAVILLPSQLCVLWLIWEMRRLERHLT